VSFHFDCFPSLNYEAVEKRPDCNQALRHSKVYMTKEAMESVGCGQVYSVYQPPGTMVITQKAALHQGYNVWYDHARSDRLHVGRLDRSSRS
jgi:hypothetical protein